MSNNYLSTQQKQRIQQLREQGLSTKVIAQRLGVSTSTITKYSPNPAKPRNYLLESPSGEIHSTCHIVHFCQQYNLNAGAIHRLMDGTCKQHKGWKVISVTEASNR